MKKIFRFLFAFFLFSFSFLIFPSCHPRQVCSVDFSETKRDFEKEGYIKATVINYQVDGCTFVLKLEDGKKIEPSNLSDAFKKDQLAVWIKYIPKKNATSVCMVGQLVELTDIQFRK